MESQKRNENLNVSEKNTNCAYQIVRAMHREGNGWLVK